jgi:hypothetical protein
MKPFKKWRHLHGEATNHLSTSQARRTRRSGNTGRYPAIEPKKFFALLDQITTSQIEAWLSLWDDEQLKLVQEYLERRSSPFLTCSKLISLAPRLDRVERTAALNAAQTACERDPA